MKLRFALCAPLLLMACASNRVDVELNGFVKVKDNSDLPKDYALYVLEKRKQNGFGDGFFAIAKIVPSPENRITFQGRICPRSQLFNPLGPGIWLNAGKNDDVEISVDVINEEERRLILGSSSIIVLEAQMNELKNSKDLSNALQKIPC